MPQPIQYGELADRLRNLLRLRGRIPTQFDENVVPTVSVGSADVPPWRQEPQWTARGHSRAATAANLTFEGVGIPPTGQGVYICRRTSVASITTAQIAVLYLGSWTSAQANATDFVVQAEAPNIETVHPNIGVGVTVGLGVTYVSGDEPSILGAVEILRTHAAVISTTVPLVIEWPVVVFPGEILTWWGATLNTGLTASWWGEYYRNDPLGRSTP
jgi:hypothetical protein